MFLKNSSIASGLEFRPGCVQLRKEGSLVMSPKCYDVAFKLRADAAAERKGKDAAARQFKVDVHVLRTIREWCSQKEKLTVLKKSGRTRSPSL